MPDYIAAALRERDLMAAYRQRPPYQQNDYIGWITSASKKRRASAASPRCWKSSPAASAT